MAGEEEEGLGELFRFLGFRRWTDRATKKERESSHFH